MMRRGFAPGRIGNGLLEKEMLTFRVTEDCTRCRSLARQMAQNHLAHKVVRVPSEDETAHSLLDGAQVVRGHQAIQKRVESLLVRRRQWQRYPSDLCFDYGDKQDA